MNTEVVYIAGKMRGLPDYGRANFDEAARQLSELGYIVLNPAMLPVGMADTAYMPICLAMVDAADCVYMIDGWQESEGARIEYHYAVCQHKRILSGNITESR